MNAVAKQETAQTTQVANAATDPMVAMIERVVMDPSADLSKLEKMLDMKERLEAEKSRRAFSDAMALCQSEIGPVAKNKNNDQTRSKYADLAAIYASCKPLIAKHGFSFSTFPARSERDGMMGVRWTLRHRDGHEESDIAEIPLDDKGMKGTANKTQTHAFGSTASYARRYLFCMIFDVATGDDNDGNARREPPQPISVAQFDTLRELIAEAGVTEDVICQAANIAAVQDLPAAQFESICKKLRKTIEAKEKQ